MGKSRIPDTISFIVGLAVMVGCGTNNDGRYLHESPAGDVGLELHDQGCPSPPDCLPSQNYTGVLLRYGSDVPIASAKYDLAPGRFGSDGSFATSAVNRDDPDDLASIDGQALDLDADQIADRVIATITFADGAQELTLDGVDPISYDHYKCWGAADVTCKPAVKLASCTVTPLGPNQYSAEADVLYKYAVPDLATPLTHAFAGRNYDSGGGTGGSSRSNFPFDGSLVTATLDVSNTRSGDDFAGTVHFDVNLIDGGPTNTIVGLIFGVTQPSGTTASSNDAECPVP